MLLKNLGAKWAVLFARKKHRKKTGLTKSLTSSNFEFELLIYIKEPSILSLSTNSASPKTSQSLKMRKAPKCK